MDNVTDSPEALIVHDLDGMDADANAIVDSVIREIEGRQGHAFGAWRPYAGPDSSLVACVCDRCGAQLVISTTTGDASGWAAARSCAALVASQKERDATERARAARWKRGTRDNSPD